MGTQNAAIHVRDTHPLVKWLGAILSDEDNIEDIHLGGPKSQSDYRRQDGHQTGQTWVVGKQLPGPRVEQPLLRATQSIDRSGIEYMCALDDFFRAAGLDEKYAKATAQFPEGQTGREISMGFLRAMQEVEVQAFGQPRSMAIAELTMHKFASMISNLSKHHRGLRNRFERLETKADL